jgi:hypothetical protein
LLLLRDLALKALLLLRTERLLLLDRAGLHTVSLEL